MAPRRKQLDLGLPASKSAGQQFSSFKSLSWWRFLKAASEIVVALSEGTRVKCSKMHAHDYYIHAVIGDSGVILITDTDIRIIGTETGGESRGLG